MDNISDWLLVILQQRKHVPYLKRIRLLYEEEWGRAQEPQTMNMYTQAKYLTKEQLLESQSIAEAVAELATAGIVVQIQANREATLPIDVERPGACHLAMS